VRCGCRRKVRLLRRALGDLVRADERRDAAGGALSAAAQQPVIRVDEGDIRAVLSRHRLGEPCHVIAMP